MESKRNIQTVSNGVFLGASGIVILLAKGILLNPISRVILVVLAAGWGIFLLIKGSESRTAGLMSLISSGVLLVFGSFLHGISTIAGIALIAAGAISFFSGFFSKGT